MILKKKDVFSKLNDPETDSDVSNGPEDEPERLEYTATDIKYNLVNKNDTTREMPKNQKPTKGYKYLGFTVLMIIILLITVFLDISSESYVDKRNQDHSHTTPVDKNKTKNDTDASTGGDEAKTNNGSIDIVGGVTKRYVEPEKDSSGEQTANKTENATDTKTSGDGGAGDKTGESTGDKTGDNTGDNTGDKTDPNTDPSTDPKTDPNTDPSTDP